MRAKIIDRHGALAGVRFTVRKVERGIPIGGNNMSRIEKGRPTEVLYKIGQLKENPGRIGQRPVLPGVSDKGMGVRRPRMHEAGEGKGRITKNLPTGDGGGGGPRQHCLRCTPKGKKHQTLVG